VGIFSVGPGGHIEHMNGTLARWLGSHHEGSPSPSRSASAPTDDMMTLDIFSAPGAALLSQRLARPTTEGFDWTLDLNTRSGRSVPVRVVGGSDAQGARVLAVVPSRAGDSPLRGDVADPSFARHFRSAPFGIATVTAAGRIASANSAFAHMVQDGSGGVDEPALAVLCRDTPADARTAVSEALTEALAGRGGTAPVDFTTGAKGEVGRRVYMTPLATAGGGGDALVLYVIDTTEQRALEAKFAQSQKMEAVGQLVGGIAHNFNNVLTAILGSADLMLQTHRASDAAHKDIQNIKQSANRAAELVSNLMAFSRQQTLRLEVLNLGDAMTDLRPMLKTSLGEKIELRISSGRDLGLVKADRSQIGQVLLNFAMNAQHAMPNGGAFTVNTRNFTEREVQKAQYPGLPTGEYVLIEVSDTGTGIPRDVVGKIFEPYFTTKEVGKGTGLGLATVYGFIKQSSGFVYVDSEVGTGTTFRVYLPRLHADDADLAVPVGKKAAAPIDLTGSAKVLIVEDEDMVRSVAVRSLKRLGYTVLEAANGYEALDIVAAENGAIDIVVSDVVMPEMDGPAFLKEVRKTNPDLRIIFVSGHTNEAFKTGMDESDVFAFLPKPFSLPQLAAKVKEELSR
jgi:two-component system, cell cycle sensor histidine kinase and response regulator CckA